MEKNEMNENLKDLKNQLWKNKVSITDENEEMVCPQKTFNEDIMDEYLIEAEKRMKEGKPAPKLSPAVMRLLMQQ